VTAAAAAAGRGGRSGGLAELVDVGLGVTGSDCGGVAKTVELDGADEVGGGGEFI
jgi:hypothetical protein